MAEQTPAPSSYRRRQKPKTPIVFIVALVIIIVYSGINLFNQQMMIDAIDADTIKASERLKEANKVNTELHQEKEALANPEYLEKIAREDLGMTRQGELPYIYNHKSKE